MHRFVLQALLLISLFSAQITGQEIGSSKRILSAQVVDDSLGFAIPSVHIWNESARMGAVSNDTGAFSIRVGNHDTLVFSAIGYWSKVMFLSPEMNPDVFIRLKPKKYEIGEVVVRRFRSYESFLYQAAHLELPESEIAELKAQLSITATNAAVDADRERAIKAKAETGGFGLVTPLGQGIDQQKIFREKMRKRKERERVIHAKFNRDLVGEITQLEGDELTEFIALCNFSDEYLYETDLYTILEALYARLNVYQNMKDTIPPVNGY